MKKSYDTKIDALIALYRCRRSGKLHNNHNRHERSVYKYKNKYYLTSMAKFRYNLIYRDSSGEIIDDENVWVRASNKLDAYSKVREEYPKASEYTFLGTI